jgi:glycosyltransferase involved in cell wall biosynthesis
MPVYIPSQLGYYRDAFKIFKACVDSLVKTTDRDALDITIIDNASIPEVYQYVEPLLKSRDVDRYIHNSINRGKADAIIAQAKASYEPFVTISDADVLFLPGWLHQVEEIYQAFPDSGVVCPFPAVHLRHYHCVSTWFNHFLRIKRGPCVNEHDLITFERTIGPQKHLSESDYRAQWSISNGNVVALIGAGHFVATYRRSAFDEFTYKPRRFRLRGGLAEIEAHVDALGFSRLSCVRNHVLHMGNVWEEWMGNNIPKVEIRSDQKISLDVCRRGSWARWMPGSVRATVAYLLLAYDKCLEHGLWNLIERRFGRRSVRMRS